ncbi:MAG: hypothetical protein FWC61_04410 [Proteobacteria bacterium]|nr:hypothetical protein [Pseudomonadota bacterium]
MKKPPIFSIVREQSVFLTILMSVLSFLAVLCLGITISIGTAVTRMHGGWDRMASVQIMPGGDAGAVQKILDAEKSRLVSANVISDEEVSRLLRPWLGGGGVLKNYIPKMIELKFKDAGDVSAMSEKLAPLQNVRFLTHAEGMGNIINAGWEIMLIAALVMVLAFFAIAACVAYITRNITMVHKRELEIMNIIGAHDKFIARQLEFAVGRISAIAAVVGFSVAAIFLTLINAMAHDARAGLLAQMNIGAAGWGALLALSLFLVILSVVITRRTVMKVLRS